MYQLSRATIKDFIARRCIGQHDIKLSGVSHSSVGKGQGFSGLNIIFVQFSDGRYLAK